MTRPRPEDRGRRLLRCGWSRGRCRVCSSTLAGRSAPGSRLPSAGKALSSPPSSTLATRPGLPHDRAAADLHPCAHRAVPWRARSLCPGAAGVRARWDGPAGREPDADAPGRHAITASRPVPVIQSVPDAQFLPDGQSFAVGSPLIEPDSDAAKPDAAGPGYLAGLRSGPAGDVARAESFRAGAELTSPAFGLSRRWTGPASPLR